MHSITVSLSGSEVCRLLEILILNILLFPMKNTFKKITRINILVVTKHYSKWGLSSSIKASIRSPKSTNVCVFNQCLASCFSTYYCSRSKIEIPVLCNFSTGGQELCLKGLRPVLCTDAHLRTDVLKGQMTTSANRSLHRVPVAAQSLKKGRDGWCFTSKAVSMTCRILDESSCSRPTSAMGKYAWSF